MFYNSKRSPGGMAQGNIPSVFVVDTNATRPAVPPRLSKEKKRSDAVQNLLILLVTLALVGLAIEACFIYRFHSFQAENSPHSEKQSGGFPVPTTKSPTDEMRPPKPMAHLTDGQDVQHNKHIMSWSRNADPILYEMNYDKGKLIIQKEGFYYIYSKVYFSPDNSFHHSVEMETERYSGGSIRLLQSRMYSKKSKGPENTSNSYLGGVFHLYKNDAIYVYISNTEQIMRHKAYENVFGAYMI
ncbi:PREDICTED: tumor necrosis factor ligand superfamily member 6-like isoform X1 [Cyprinodon variegatus]|uniref:TNF superfamily member 14 n=1 Tax=Cyprinodon variegatus TaxID=28743 RepID=A0A3Q2C656_CYPVA|nr:PREDICTED: tumor necrosis factor ligand superfamily member 6-like isoform X1 [Cyprinodon variegatus]